MWIVFLISIFLNGYILSLIILQKKQSSALLPSSFVLGSLFSVNGVYLLAILFGKNLLHGLIWYFLFCLVSYIFFLKKRKQYIVFRPTVNSVGSLLLVELIIFFFFVFSKTFHYSEKTGDFLIASHVYMDFGAHIAFIRSFSLGNNFPAEVPFFAGSGLFYHFMFYLYAGILEFLGLRIDIALNLLSSLSFVSVCFMIYILTNTIFRNNKYIGVLAVFFFVFNSSLSFLSFFKQYGFTVNALLSMWRHASYFHDIPLGGSFVAGFWSLNTFFNQRHLLIALLFALYVVYFLISLKEENIIKKRKILLIGFLIGLFPFWHTMIFLGIMLFLVTYIIVVSHHRFVLVLFFTSLLFSLPAIFLIKVNSVNEITFNPGFLISNALSIENFIRFWVLNLGFSIFAFLLGFFLSNRKQKKLFLVCMVFFIIPNVFAISTRFIFDNHKFFNLWIIFMNMFSAMAIMYLLKKKAFFKGIGICLFLLLTFSGVIDNMVFKNDVLTTIVDYKKNSLMQWSLKNIPPSAVVATNGEIYDPMSIIGKKILIGRSWYVYVYGGDPDSALQDQASILLGNNKQQAAKVIQRRDIQYIIIYKDNFAKNVKIYNRQLLDETYKKVYEDNYGVIFKI